MAHKFGDKITVNHKLVRRAKGNYKFWRVDTIAEKEVIIIGVRTLSNGDRIWEEYGWEYIQKETFKALLVACSLREKPFYITPPGGE